MGFVRVKFTTPVGRFNRKNFTYIPIWSLIVITNAYPRQIVELDIDSDSVWQLETDIKRVFHCDCSDVTILEEKSAEKSKTAYVRDAYKQNFHPVSVNMNSVHGNRGPIYAYTKNNNGPGLTMVINPTPDIYSETVVTNPQNNQLITDTQPATISTSSTAVPNVKNFPKYKMPKIVTEKK